jgi:hypothetical protein
MQTAGTGSGNVYSALLEQPGRIGPKDVLKFRNEIFRDGIVNAAEADAIVALNDAVGEKSAEWREFYVEALADFIVHQAEPRGYVSVANADWLIAAVSRDGKVETVCELEILVKVLDRATSSPDRLVRFVLDQIGRAVLEGEGPLARGGKLEKGAINEAEVELLRRVLYAVGGDGGISISRVEAEFLFELNDRTASDRNHKSWQDLFVKAIANYLMAAATGKPVSRTAALKREEWLDSADESIGATLSGAFGMLGQMFSGAFMADMSDAHEQIERAWAAKNAETQAAIAEAAVISQVEADWLIERMSRDGRIHDNEKALLAFLKRESPDIHPSLKPWFAKIA